MSNQDIGKEFKRISNLMKREIDKVLTEENTITKNQGIILRMIKLSKKEIYQKDIEKELLVRRPTATKMLNLMEQKGLIIRKKSNKDARLKQLILTEKGKELEKKNYYKILEVENKLKSKLTKEELNTLFQLLEKIENILTKEDENND